MREDESEFFGLQQGVGQIDQKTDGHDRSQGVVERHLSSPSEPVAGVGVADRNHEQAEPQGQQQDIQHCCAPDEKLCEVEADHVTPRRN